MNAKTISACLLCLAVGGVAGHLLTRAGEQSNDGATPRAASTGRPSLPGARLSLTRHAETNERKWPLPPSDAKPGSPVAANRELIEVPPTLLAAMSRARGVRSLDQAILDERDPVEASLGLSASEKTRIQAEWQRAGEDLRKIETAAVHSTDLDDGSVRMELPDLSREREQLTQQFRKAITAALGHDRGEAFCAIKQTDEIIAAGSGKRTITVKTESVGVGRWGYRMILDDASGQRVWVGENIPDEIRHLTDAAGIFPTTRQAVQAMPPE